VQQDDPQQLTVSARARFHGSIITESGFADISGPPAIDQRR
jgi:hypothetical protein